MRRTSITRQFIILVTAFAVVMPASLGGLAYVFYESRASTRTRAAANVRRTDALFALVESVGQVQGTVQHLLREKDPDNMEKLMGQSKSESNTVRGKIQEAGATGGDEIGRASCRERV